MDKGINASMAIPLLMELKPQHGLQTVWAAATLLRCWAAGLTREEKGGAGREQRGRHGAEQAQAAGPKHPETRLQLWVHQQREQCERDAAESHGHRQRFRAQCKPSLFYGRRCIYGSHLRMVTRHNGHTTTMDAKVCSKANTTPPFIPPQTLYPIRASSWLIRSQRIKSLCPSMSLRGL